MRNYARKSAPEVAGGRVQKKNNHALTPNYYSHRQPELVVDRKRPGQGYRHVLTRRDVLNFIALLPDWAELSRGLDAIVLAPGEWSTDGYHVPGVVHVCAWDEDLWVEYTAEHYECHKSLFDRLGMPGEAMGNGFLCKFNEDTVRAYQLLHILLHELGHHHDRITTQKQKRAGRGEPYAEAYALAYEARIWDAYRAAFGLL